MGFDVSYHPIREEEMKEWYFDRLEDVKKGDFSTLNKLGKDWNMNEFYLEKYIDMMKKIIFTKEEDNFEITHAYYLAIIQGFFRVHYYTRGTAFSFLLEKNPEMKKYVSSWETIKPDRIKNKIVGKGIVANYSGGLYFSAKQIAELLEDYKSGKIKQKVDNFFEQNLPVFLHALEYAVENHLGILEATEVVEPNPLDLNQSTSYSNLFHCDIEGALLYQETALKQLQSFAKEEGKEVSEILEKTSYHKTYSEQSDCEIIEEKPKKKSWFQKLFGRK